MPNKMNHAEVAERLLYLDSHIDSDNDVRVLARAAADENRIANGELAEVVHAHWIEKTAPWNMGCEKYLACSNCGAKQAETYEENGNKYCDECGALMNGKDDSHE